MNSSADLTQAQESNRNGSPFEYKDNEQSSENINDGIMQKASLPLNKEEPSFVQHKAKEKNTIKVIVKVKGGEQELSNDERIHENDFQICQNENKINFKSKGYSFTYVMDSDCSQIDTYETQCSNVIKKLFEGYNGAIFVYGGSGSGKTYTMVGPESYIKEISTIENLSKIKDDDAQVDGNQQYEDDSRAGIIIRSMKEIFNTCNKSNQSIFQLCVKYFEVYKEDIYDLISKNKSVKIDSKQKKSKTIPITNCVVKSMSEVYKLIKLGQQRKKEFPTLENTRSSRSHTVFVCELLSKDSKGRQRRAKLNLIDLAGIEKLKNLGESERLIDESKKINLSILYLSICIKKLSENSSHIPYRDSVLTNYLKDTLKGNANTVIICTVSRKAANAIHTQLTLEFGLNAQLIKTTPIANVQDSIPALKNKIKKLELENAELKSKIRSLNLSISEEQKDNKQLIHNEDGINALLERITAGLDDNEEYDESQAILESSTTTFNQLNQTISSDISELTKFRCITTECDSDMSFDNSQLDYTNTQNKSTIKKLGEAIVKLEQRIAQNNETIIYLQDEISICEEKHKEEILDKNNKIQKETILKNQALDRMKELQDQNLYMNESLSDKEKEIQELNSHIEALNSDINRREEYSIELNEMINETNKMNLELQSQNDTLQSSLTETESKLKEALTTSSMNKCEIDSLVKQQEESCNRISSLEECIKTSLQKHTEEIQEKDNLLKSKNDEIRELNDAKTDKSNSLDIELQESKNTILSLKEENEIQKSKISSLDQKTEFQIQEIDSLKSQIANSSDLLKQEREAVLVQKYTEEIENTKSELDKEKQRAKEFLVKGVSKAIALKVMQTVNKNAALREGIEKKNIVEAKNNEIEKLSTMLKDKENKEKEDSQAKAETESKYIAKIEEQEQIISSLKASLSETKQKSSEIESTNKLYQISMNDEMLKKFKKRVKKCQKRINELKQSKTEEIAELNNQIEQLKQINASELAENERIFKDLEDLKKKIKKAKKKLRRKEKAIKELKEKEKEEIKQPREETKDYKENLRKTKSKEFEETKGGPETLVRRDSSYDESIEEELLQTDKSSLKYVKSKDDPNQYVLDDTKFLTIDSDEENSKYDKDDEEDEDDEDQEIFEDFNVDISYILGPENSEETKESPTFREISNFKSDLEESTVEIPFTKEKKHRKEKREKENGGKVKKEKKDKKSKNKPTEITYLQDNSGYSDYAFQKLTNKK